MENRATGTCTLFEQDDIKELLESDDIILTLALALTKTLVSRESALPPFFFFFSCALFHVARARVCHQSRGAKFNKLLTVFSLVYPEEGSIAETSVKVLIITASVLQFLHLHVFILTLT